MNNLLKLIFIAFITSLTFIPLLAQTDYKPDFSKALKVGDNFVPPKSVQLMRGADKSFNWKALEDKVVLLDFFDTFCGSCIQIMPKLQKMQQQMGDKFVVLTVTWQDKATIEKLFATNTYLKQHKVNLPVIYNDVYLKGLFPHLGAPHEVLLFKGKVHAITSSQFITEGNVLKLYADKTIDLPLKDDFGKGNLLGKLSAGQGGLKAGVLFSGYQDGVPFQAWKFNRDSATGLYKSSSFNMTVFLALRTLAFKAKLSTSLYIPRMERIIWNVKDSTKYYDFANNDSEQWRVKNGICYERYDMVERPDSIQARIILQDFANFYGLKIYPAKRKINALVLKPCPVVKTDQKREGKSMRYTESSVLSLLDLSEKYPPVLDKVNYKQRIELYPFESLDELNVQLANYGIKAEIEMEEMDVQVIEEI